MFGAWTLVLLIAAYLLGAVPFGQIVAKAAGRDLSRAGSGNTGAANAYRQLGWRAGVAVLAADLLKGSIACCFGYIALVPSFAVPIAKAVFGLLAVLGHNYSVFRGFKGGKGIATTFGVVLVMSPRVALLAALLWVACVALTKYASVGSIAAVAAMPILMALQKGDLPSILFCVAAAGLAIFRHRENLERLRQGRELQYDERDA
jgi:glycerol-3-phosphate acyltransferase PlsY